MNDRTPEQIADDANRILLSPVFQNAVQKVKDDALAELLRASGPDSDITRREMANLINAVSAVENAIRAEAANAAAALKPRGQVA